jgi:hypothetical protein
VGAQGTSGLSYTVTAAIDKPAKGTAAGIDKIVELGIVDAYKPSISPATPFYVRVGICYASANGPQPASASSFTIARGYHSYGGGTIGAGPDDVPLRAFYNKLNNLYVNSNNNHEDCDNLVGNNLLPGGVPSNPLGGLPINLQCPSNPLPCRVSLYSSHTVSAGSLHWMPGRRHLAGLARMPYRHDRGYRQPRSMGLRLSDRYSERGLGAERHYQPGRSLQ